MANEADLREENRILRERVSQLEGDRSVDPVLRALLDNAPTFLAVITPEGRFVATGRTSEAFGSVVGRSVFEFTQADQHALMREAFARACATKQPLTYESIGYGENGELGHTYLTRVVPLIEAGAVSTLLLVPADITDRVRLERSLSLSEQKLRLAVEATSMGLWSWDIARDEVLWDRRALEIFGVSEPPRDYEAFLGLIHPADRARLGEVVGRALETGVYTPVEHRLSRPAEIPERWILGTGAITRDESGQPTMMMGGVLDITAQKHAAAHVSRAQRVEALGQLSAGLAHNFNNVLGTIIPNLELALEHAVPDGAASISAALGAAMQARDLVKRLLAITAPRSAEAAKVSDPRAVVERAVALCRASFPREIQIDVTVAAGVGHAAMAATDLDQVILNLLFNARDALEALTGRPRTIAVHVDAPAGSAGPRVRVRVRDNGVGMSQPVAARVFEPFFTTKPDHRGAGLGLADALVRVRDAGGQIDVASAARRRHDLHAEPAGRARPGRGRRRGGGPGPGRGPDDPHRRRRARAARRHRAAAHARWLSRARGQQRRGGARHAQDQGWRDQAHPARPVDAARVGPRGAAFVEAAQRRAHRAVHGRYLGPAARRRGHPREARADRGAPARRRRPRGPRRLSRTNHGSPRRNLNVSLVAPHRPRQRTATRAGSTCRTRRARSTRRDKRLRGEAFADRRSGGGIPQSAGNPSRKGNIAPGA